MGVYPSMINAVNLLSKQNNSIEIWSTDRESNFPKPPKFKKSIKFFRVVQNCNYDRNFFCLNNRKSVKHNLKSNSIGKLFPDNFKVIYRRFRNILLHNIETSHYQINWINDKLRFFILCIGRCLKKDFDIIIAVDSIGILSSMFCSFLSRKKPLIIFWSLEIDTGKSTLLINRLFDILFCFSVKFTDILVIQEETRLKTLSKNLDFYFDKRYVALIPHSPIGSRIDQFKINFFREKFAFTKDDSIILHAGWIHDSMCVDQLAACCVNWKHTYKLVLHEREFRSENEPFIQHVIQLSEGKAHLSLQPVCFDRIDEVFSSARIGIIAYDKRYGGGRENAHKASGKLGHYLKCGVPVIALDLPGYREMFEKYKCGMVFQDFNEVEQCIDIIISNYASYSSEALRCFQDEFEFNKYFDPFYQFLEKFTKQLYI